ncbi:transcriptional regulator [Listeria monocytogenes]|nr:transcriptional regulator [Listeria monocytogenes]
MAIIILKKRIFTVYIKLFFLEKLAFLFKKSKKVCLVKK